MEREQKSANTQVPACATCDCVQLLCSRCWAGLHIVPCMAQGVSGKVKERMEAAASGTDGGARPMLLFPEVRNHLVTAFVLQGLLLCDPLSALCFQGTTTNGQYLLPFKSGAFLAGAPVQPVLIRYGKVRFPALLNPGVRFCPPLLPLTHSQRKDIDAAICSCCIYVFALAASKQHSIHNWGS